MAAADRGGVEGAEDIIALTRGLDAVLGAGRPTAEALRDALQVLVEQLGIGAAAFWQRTQGGDAVRPIAAVGAAAAVADDAAVARALDGPCVVREGGTLLVPAGVGGELLGVLALEAPAEDPTAEAHCELAAGLLAALLRLVAAEERFDAVTGSSIDALVIADAEGRIVTFNARAEEMFGWSCEEVVGRPLTVLMPERFRAAHERALRGVSAGAPPRLLGRVLELTARRKSGEELPVELTLGTWTVGAQRCYTGSFRDVSERVRTAERIERLVYTHSRTGLANEADLRRRLATGVDGGVVVAVGVGRLDVVVEELGSKAGEATMREAARLLGEVVPAGGSVHHREGDVLLALLPGRADEELVRVGERCVAALSGVPVVAGQELVLEPAVGLAVVGPDEPVRAVDHALRALGAAREAGPGEICCFGEVVERRRATLAVEAELRRGIARGELVLHYQPVVTLATGRIRAVEALVRWQHPERGLLGPGAFIALAERTSLIDELGGWVVEESCRQLAAWQAEGRDLRVSFNVSPRQLRRGGVTQRLEEAIRVTGARPDRLIAEVTETTAVEDLDEGRDVLSACARLGMGVALDDFGTGRSSLGRLAELPVDALKLDRSLVSGLPDGRAARALVRASTQLARGLGLRVVAEGVERPEQLRWLRETGCDLAQGYLLSRPVPAAEVPDAVAAAESACVPPPAVAHAPGWSPHGDRWLRGRTRLRHRDC